MKLDLTEDEKEVTITNIHQIFQNELNSQGHPFQQAVIRRVEELGKQKPSPSSPPSWIFEAIEFPVEVQGSHTRVDFVLSQQRRYPGESPRFLVAECKRANPALKHWCFAEARYVRRNLAENEVLAESIHLPKDSPSFLLTADPARIPTSKSIYRIALEVKGTDRGDSKGSGRGAIEDAVTQVMRGVNGLIEHFSKHRQFFKGGTKVVFIPAVFTTAKLWTTSTDISSASLANGQVDIDPAGISEQEWLWFEYPVSPGLKHSIDRQRTPDPTRDVDLGEWDQDLSALMEREYARTIAIVGPKGIESFLKTHLEC